MVSKSITSLQHPLVKKICKLRENNTFRREENLVLVTKDAIIKEINQFLEIELLLFIEDSQFHENLNAKEKISVSKSILSKCVGYESQDTCAALFKIPSKQSTYTFPWLVLDGIQDPGNLGNLMRSALAFNFRTIILLQGSCDPFSDKSIKASRGSIFHLEIHQMSSEDFLILSRARHSEIFFADAKGVEISSIVYPQKMCLVLGNEGHGVSKNIQGFGKSIAIKMNPLSESLNVSVAGSIIMHQIIQGTHD